MKVTAGQDKPVQQRTELGKLTEATPVSGTVAATLLLALLVPASASAGPSEAVKSAADATARGVEKGKDAVVHVVEAAASGIAYGGNKAGQAIMHVAKKAGLQTEPTSTPKT